MCMYMCTCSTGCTVCAFSHTCVFVWHGYMYTHVVRGNEEYVTFGVPMSQVEHSLLASSCILS